MHYPPETTSIALIARIIAMIEGSSERETLIQTLMSVSFCSSGVYHLNLYGNAPVANISDGKIGTT